MLYHLRPKGSRSLTALGQRVLWEVAPGPPYVRFWLLSCNWWSTKNTLENAKRPVLCFCWSSNACMSFVSQCHVCRNKATLNNSLFARALCHVEHCCHIAQSCVPLSMQFSSWSIYCTLMTPSGQKNTVQNFFFLNFIQDAGCNCNSWSVEGWGPVIKRSESGVKGSPGWLRTPIWLIP